MLRCAPTLSLSISLSLSLAGWHSCYFTCCYKRLRVGRRRLHTYARTHTHRRTHYKHTQIHWHKSRRPAASNWRTAPGRRANARSQSCLRRRHSAIALPSLSSSSATSSRSPCSPSLSSSSSRFVIVIASRHVSFGHVLPSSRTSEHALAPKAPQKSCDPPHFPPSASTGTSLRWRPFYFPFCHVCTRLPARTNTYTACASELNTRARFSLHFWCGGGSAWVSVVEIVARVVGGVFWKHILFLFFVCTLVRLMRESVWACVRMWCSVYVERGMCVMHSGRWAIENQYTHDMSVNHYRIYISENMPPLLLPLWIIQLADCAIIQVIERFFSECLLTARESSRSSDHASRQQTTHGLWLLQAVLRQT